MHGHVAEVVQILLVLLIFWANISHRSDCFLNSMKKAFHLQNSQNLCVFHVSPLHAGTYQGCRHSVSVPHTVVKLNMVDRLNSDGGSVERWGEGKSVRYIYMRKNTSQPSSFQINRVKGVHYLTVAQIPFFWLFVSARGSLFFLFAGSARAWPYREELCSHRSQIRVSSKHECEVSTLK